jgi:hypothetical protein
VTGAAYDTAIARRAPHEAGCAVLGGSAARAGPLEFRAPRRLCAVLPDNNLQNAPKGALLLPYPSYLLTIYPPPPPYMYMN